MEAFHVCVPWVDPKKSAEISAGYRYCVTAREKRNGDVVLFCPSNLTSYLYPSGQLRKPLAYPRDLRPRWLASEIRRRLKQFKRHGRRADGKTAKAVLAQLEQVTRRTLPVAALALALSACSALSDRYVSVGGGGMLPLNTNQDEIEARSTIQPAVELGAGARVTPWLTADARFNWMQTDIHGYDDQSADGSYDTVSVTVGGRVNAPVDGPLSWLYVGGGVGPALELVDGSNGSQDGLPRKGTNVELAYEARAGIRVPVGERVTIDAGWRYFATSGITEGHGPSVSLAWRF